MNYKRLFEAAPAPLLVVDRELIIVTANDAYLEATMTTEEEIVGRHIFDVFPDNPDSPMATGVRNLRRSLESVLQQEATDAMAIQRYDIRRPDGSFEERHWSPKNAPVFDNEGNLTHIVHRVEDVTEFVKLQRRGEDKDIHIAQMEGELFERSREIQEKNKRLEAALGEVEEIAALLREESENKDRFLAMLGHELRNPLAAISSAVNLQQILLSDNDIGERGLRESMEIIERQLLHLTRLVDDLLDLARVTSGRIELERVPVDLQAVIHNAVEMTRHYIAAGEHELDISLPEQSVMVRGDQNRLVQVVANLLDNAAKYTPRGGKIEVRVTVGEERATIEVRDNGTGIESELFPHIFDVFRQADQPLARSDGGLGLGLALVRQLVEAHHGAVDAISEGSGTGSRFFVHLPVIEHRLTASETDEEVRDSPHRIILLVDDNEDAVTVLRVLMERDGHTVHVAYDGLSALEAARQVRPELIFLDIGLPELDGFQVARRLHGQGLLEHTTLVALTGYGLPEDVARARDHHFDHYLVKPIDLEELRQLLVAGA